MLSRVADTLYWMSRYIERAEDITRVLTVNFNTLLDSRVQDSAESWRRIIEITGDGPLFANEFGDFNETTVSAFVLWHPSNPNAVTTCVRLARENARSVREQISSEMWEHLNRLYFLVRDIKQELSARGPYDFFDQIRHGSQAFQGITNETMAHSEAYEFIQLGKHLERADKTVRIIDVKYSSLNNLRGGPEVSLQLLAMLRSCSAFEAFRKSPGSQLHPARVTDFLLLSQEFPRAVSYCLQRALRSVNLISGDPASPRQLLNPQRALGRICSELGYLEINELLNDKMHPYLDSLLYRLNELGDEIGRTYFNTQLILPPQSAASQHVQQQQ